MPAIDFITELIPTYLERITLAVGGAIGGAWAVAFDGVHLSIDWLLAFMFSDYIAGLYKAFVLGEYSSSKCANGLIKKSIILWLCALAHGLDVISGLNVVQQIFIGAFALNEMLSIIENVGLVHPGLIPTQIQQLLQRLKQRGARP